MNCFDEVCTCYLLCSLNPEFPKSTYIGFTVNPKRRIRQHNGEIASGAKRTSKKRPWEMCLLVHGFPSRSIALQFEWMWQHPDKSRFLKESGLKGVNKRSRIKVLLKLLQLSIFKNLNLQVHVMNESCNDLLVSMGHTAALYGSIEDVKYYQTHVQVFMAKSHLLPAKCKLCSKEVEFKRFNEFVVCGKAGCFMVSHLKCLAQVFQGNFLPLKGQCPSCSHDYVWSDLIKHMQHNHAFH